MEIEPSSPTSEEIQTPNPQPTATFNTPECAVASQPQAEEGGEETEKRKREDEDEDEGIPPGIGDGGGGGGGGDSDRNPLWKTTLCSYFRRQPDVGCSHGEACRYAHGEAELRPRPDNSWDPTSQRAKKLLKPNESESQGKVQAAFMVEEELDPTVLDKCLIGLSRNWASDRLKSFLDGHGILYKTAKKKKGMTVGFVCFENIEQVQSAIEVLNENPTGGKQIKIADAIRRSHENKHSTEIAESHPSGDDGDATGKEASEVEGLVSKTRSARDVVTSLAHMPYSDQLEHKKNSLLQTLKRLTRNARKACPHAVPLPEWILKSREIGGLPCKFEGILESPLVNGYRNKCEFSLGHSLHGKRTVGFLLGNFREGVTAVEEPVNCPNVPRISCKYALIFQEFLQSSVFPVWNRIDNTGFWRQFTVREGRDPGQVIEAECQVTHIAEVMLIIQVCSSGVDEAIMKKEFQRMAQALAQGAAACTPPLPLTTIVVQDHKGISNAAPADCPLLPLPVPKLEGNSCSEESPVPEARIHDYISNLRFCISPTAFFQVNTLAAERLYSLAGDWAELSPDTLLFDICCGTGTIGLTLANCVGMVIGVEMNDSAVLDACRNAEINGIKNCKFVCGKAEDVMATLLKEYLGGPQQPSAISEILGCNDMDDVGTTTTKDDNVGTTDTKDEENLQPDVDVSDDVLATNASSKEILSCSGNSSIIPTKECIGNGSIAYGISNHETDGIEGSMGFSTICATECRSTGQENEECTEVSREDNCRGTNEKNTACRDASQETVVSEENVGTVATPLGQFKDVVAIVDPPRGGLHPSVIKALRTHPRIRRLVYISCNPESLVANAIELCTPTADEREKGKGNRGWRKMSSASLARLRTKSMPSSEPFRPVRAMAVDLFPHTPHCEMVMLLKR